MMTKKQISNDLNPFHKVGLDLEGHISYFLDPKEFRDLAITETRIYGRLKKQLPRAGICYHIQQIRQLRPQFTLDSIEACKEKFSKAKSYLEETFPGKLRNHCANPREIEVFARLSRAMCNLLGNIIILVNRSLTSGVNLQIAERFQDVIIQMQSDMNVIISSLETACDSFLC